MRISKYLKSLTAVISLFASSEIYTHGDVVSEWNTTAATYLGQYGGKNYLHGMTMVHVAQFDAVNGVLGGYTPYALSAIAPNGSAEAAAAQAAYTILTNISRSDITTLNNALKRSLSAIAEGPAKDDGVALGRLAAVTLIQLRAPNNPELAITPPQSSVIGKWRVTPPNQSPGEGANARYLLPWTMRSPSEFRPGPPPSLNSELYAADLNEARLLGARNSTNRTVDQKEAAQFHAAPDLTYLRPALAAKTLSLIETSRAVALYYMARTDAAIAFLEAQYAYSYWRPYSAIRQADQDGNEATDPEVTWQPLLDTPNHPEYPSGTCTFTAASIEILKHFFGDDFAFTGSYDGAIKPRKFARLSAAVDDAIVARIAAGAHFRNSCVTGVTVGKAIAQNALSQWLRVVPRFVGVNALLNGEFQVQLKPGPSQTYVIETSADLLSWVPAVTNVLGSVIYGDQDSSGAKFYRATIQR